MGGMGHTDPTSDLLLLPKVLGEGSIQTRLHACPLDPEEIP